MLASYCAGTHPYVHEEAQRAVPGLTSQGHAAHPTDYR